MVVTWYMGRAGLWRDPQCRVVSLSGRACFLKGREWGRGRKRKGTKKERKGKKLEKDKGGKDKGKLWRKMTYCLTHDIKQTPNRAWEDMRVVEM